MMLRESFARFRQALESQILGQPSLVESLIIGLLCEGHLLLEGPPGVAKTRAVRALATGISADFHRIQFTPDLLPADLTGGEIFRPGDGSFHFEPGPVFHSILLADEINRAPAKVQSALLEAMGERQVSIGQHTRPLPDLFMVLATQNPIEQEGTYPLPEAQLDRFLMKLSVGYPDPVAEQAILAMVRDEIRHGYADTAVPPAPTFQPLSLDQVFAARRAVMELHLAPALETYLVDLVMATRYPERIDPTFAGVVRLGASPRGSLGLERAARARAWLEGRDYVSPADIQAVAPAVLGHRILLSYAAELDGLTPAVLIERLLAAVIVP